MTRPVVGPAGVLHTDRGRRLVVRHDARPQALALVPLRRDERGGWTLVDAAGRPTDAASRAWLDTVKIAKGPDTAEPPARIDEQWRWAVAIDELWPGAPAGDALLLVITAGPHDHTWFAHQPMQPMARTPARTPPAAPQTLPPEWHEAIHAAVGRRGLPELVDAALVNWS